MKKKNSKYSFHLINTPHKLKNKNCRNNKMLEYKTHFVRKLTVVKTSHGHFSWCNQSTIIMYN